MAKFSLKIWHLFLVGLLMTPLLHCTGPTVVSAEYDDEEEDGVVESEDLEDEVEGEDMEVADEEEDEEPVTVPDVEDEEDEESAVAEDEEEEEEEEEELGPHPNADTTIIFTNRPTNEFVAGEIIHSLIGFFNTGEQEDLIVLGIEASFRYPQDFSYFIQNFTMITYETYIRPNTEVSFVYSFRPSESFYARPFGLVINIYYKDDESNDYRTAVFNSTVNIVEIEEGFDAETFFMYVFMVSGISLLMFIIHYVYTTVRRGGRSSSRKYVETGTQSKGDVDYQWIPEGATTTAKKSPRPSPRNRKTNKK